MKTIQNKLMHTKTLLILLFLAVTPLINFAQSSIFEKYEDFDEVTNVVVTKHAFKLLSKVSSDTKEGKEYKQMVSNLDNLTVYTTENTKIATQMQNDVKKYLKNTKLSELVRVKDKDANVKIYVREGNDENHVSEFFMYINNLNKSIKGNKPEAIIVSLTGNIDLNKIGELANKMNIPGGKHLQNVSKK